MFLMDEKGENAQVLDTVKLPTCTHLDIKHDVTLRGGIKSGNFTKLGYLRDMQTCVDACCQDQKCDVAFMPGHVCYSVSCFSEKLCESIPAVPSIAANRSVRISHVVRGGGKGDDLEQFKKTQGMAKYSKLNFSLHFMKPRVMYRKMCVFSSCITHTPFLNVTSTRLINNVELNEGTCDKDKCFASNMKL